MMSTEVNIRDAAVRLFAERGFAGTGIRDLAREAGITTASLYHYIGTKDDLLVHVMRTGLGSLLERAEHAAERTDDPVHRLAELVRVHATTHALHPLSCAVVDGELRALPPEARDEMVALRDRYEALWAETLEAGRDQGLVIAEDLHLTRLHLLDLCTGIMRWYRPDGERALDDIVERLVDVSLRVAGATRDGRVVTAADVPGGQELADELAERRRAS